MKWVTPLLYLLITFTLPFRSQSSEEPQQNINKNAVHFQEPIQEEDEDDLIENITPPTAPIPSTFEFKMQQPSLAPIEEDIIKELESPDNEQVHLPLQKRIVRKDVLWLERENITDTLLIKAVRLPEFKNLQFLYLSGNPIGDASIYAIGKNIPHLLTLNLKESNISNDGVLEIAKHLLLLRDLNLSCIPIKKSGAKVISANLTNLEKLKLIACQLSPSACAKLAAGIPNIRKLNLAHNHFDHEGVQALFSNPHSYLISLNLTFNGVRDIEIMRLSRSEWFNNLRELNLSHNPVGKFTIKYITKHLKNLKTLDLSRCHIRDEEAIIIATKLLHLHTLILEDNVISNKGIIALATAPFVELKMLNVLGNPIGEKSVVALEAMQEKTKGRTYVYWG